MEKTGSSLSLPKALVWGLLWFAALGGSLLLSMIPLPHTDHFCGVWGCYPPFESLISMHLFWIVLILGPTLLYGWWKPCAARPLSWWLLLIGSIVSVMVIVLDLTAWLGDASSHVRRFWLNRVQYTLLTQTQFPTIQWAIVGGIGLMLSPRSTCSSHSCEGDADFKGPIEEI